MKYYTVKKRKTKSKRVKKSKKIKKKYIKKQKGGGILDYSSYTLEDINEYEPGRFEFNKLYGNFQIIDKEYNKRYLYTEGGHFNVLIDDLNEIYYAFDHWKGGVQITNGSIDHKLIEDTFEEASKEKDSLLAENLLEGEEIMVKELSYEKSCYTPFNLDVVKAKIDDLNKIFKKKCPNLELQFDHYYNLKGKITAYEENDYLIICLYYKKICISSIILETDKTNIDIDNNIVSISSQTDEKFQGNKFNKLLRCVAIIISSILICNDTDGPFTTLRSNPINPISAWLLISNFKTNVRDIDDSIDKKYERELFQLKAEYPDLSDNEIKKKLVFEKKYEFKLIDVPLDAENVGRAERIFNELDIVCPP